MPQRCADLRKPRSVTNEMPTGSSSLKIFLDLRDRPQATSCVCNRPARSSRCDTKR
jgi:hypothetical protein